MIEPDKNWVNAAVLLVRSLRRNGGAHSMCLIDGVQRVTTAELRDALKKGKAVVEGY